MKCAGFGSMAALPVSQIQIAGYAYQINYLAYLIEKIQKDIANLDPESQGEAITTLQANVEALQEALADKSTVIANPAATGSETALNRVEIDGTKYRIEGAGGGNAYVEVSQQTTVYADSFSLNVNALPDGAVIDKIEALLNLSGGTVPTKIEIIPTSSTVGISAVAAGGYCNWTLSYSVSGSIAYISCNMASTQTLYNNRPASGDTGIWGRVYYHV